MAKKVLLVLAVLASLASTSCSKGFRVLLYNNAKVDLTVRVDDKTIAADIGPGESAEIYWQESQWIDFGMIGHLYEHKGSMKVEGFYDIDKDIVKVQADNDGRLYLVPSATEFPVKTIPKQPQGFPLSPSKVVDLT